MGRQKGQSQRTKGNVQPSSSRKAATLLSENQKFVGFESLSGELGYIPMLKSLEDDKEAIIDPDIRVSFSKLGKKDAITKIKALTELTDLCSTKPTRDIIAVLVYWPRLYNRLCDDNDRKVREMCQVAFTAMLKSVGKEIAPYLKGVMGWWLISQCDPHPPVLSAAKNAFVVTFPQEEKQKKALIFCSKEILQCIHINLFTNLQVDSFSGLKNDKNKDRRISASLSALAFFLKVSNFEEQKNSFENMQAIFENPKFWKFSKDESPAVRASFYVLLSSFCKFLPNIVSLQLTSTGKCIMHKLNEPNPLIAKSIWEAVSSFVSKFSTWHEVIDIRKGFLPQLWGLIKKGFHGNAKQISMQIPFLLDHFPSSLAVSPIYDELFKCLIAGLRCKNALRSSIESNAIIECYFQCKLVILQKIFQSSADNNLQVASSLWDQHTYPLLKSSFEDTNLAAFIHKSFATFFNKFMDSIPLDSKKSDKFEFCSILWNNFTDLGKESIEKSCVCTEDQSYFSSYVNFLSQVIGTPSLNKAGSYAKKSKTVKFNICELEDNALLVEPDLKQANSFLVAFLNQCICHNINYVFNSSGNAMSKLCLLDKLLRNFSSASLFEKYTEFLHSKNDPLCFINDCIFSLIENIDIQLCTRDHYLQIASSIYFSIRHCQEDVASNLVKIFSKLDQCNAHSVSTYLVHNVIDDHNLISLCDDRTWLSKFILNTVKELINADAVTINDKWNLIRVALSEKKLISLQDAQDILKFLNNYVERYPKPDEIIQINILYSTWFAAFSENVDLLDITPEFFFAGLHPLLNLSVKCPDGRFRSCLKDFFSVMLNKSFISNHTETRNFVISLCCHCAMYLRNMFFEQKLDFEAQDGFKQSIVIMAEELVMHHTKQISIIEWLNCVLPTSEQLDKLRLPFGSSEWPVAQILNNEFQTCCSNAFDNYYFEAVQQYIGLFAELGIIYSENYSNVLEQPQYSTLFYESLFAKAIATSTQYHLVKVGDYLPALMYSDLFSQIVHNSINYGNGWILVLDQFASWSSCDYWDTKMFMDLTKLDSLTSTQNVLFFLKVFIKHGTCVSVLQNILEWCFEKFVYNHLQFVKEGIEPSPGILSVLVSLFERISKQQEKNPLHTCLNEFIPCHIQVIENIMEWKSFLPSMFLFDVDLTKVCPFRLQLNLEIIKFLKFLVDVCPGTINADTWDFIECSFISWMESCVSTFKSEVVNLESNVKELFFHICNLMLSLEQFVTSPASMSDPSLPSSLGIEWGEFFKPAAHSSLIFIFTTFAHQEVDEKLLKIVGKCLATITSGSLVASASALDTHLLPGSDLSNDVQTLLHHLCLCLVPSDFTDFSVPRTISHSLLNVLTKEIFVNLKDTSCYKPPLHFIKCLGNLLPKVDDSINLIFKNSGVSKKKFSSVEEYSDENSSNESVDTEDKPEFDDLQAETINSSYLFSYFLVWKLLIKLFRFVPAEARTQYAASLNQNQLTDISTLLSKLILFFPKYPFIVTTNESEESKIDMFKEEELDFNSVSNLVKIQYCVCTLYKDVLIYLPALARSWFNSLQKKNRNYVDDFTSTHVTPVITKTEMESISLRTIPTGLIIRPRVAAREVVASYEISDAHFQISIQLPINYPLSAVQINTVRKVGISASQWRYWLLQMTMLLQKQNGKIVDALTLWKDKVDKKLDGLEECMICFSVIHGSNSHSLPKLQCKTCRKKFHAECLYKWFDTSNQSTCPLCRSPMMFR